MNFVCSQANMPQTAHHAENAARANTESEAWGKLCFKRCIRVGMRLAPFGGISVIGAAWLVFGILWETKIALDYYYRRFSEKFNAFS